MKRVIFHYTVMREVEVADECPTENIDKTKAWMDDNDYRVEEIKMEIRDREILAVEKIYLLRRELNKKNWWRENERHKHSCNSR